MSAIYHLEFTVPQEMMRRATTSWARKQRSGWGRVKFFALCVVTGAAIGGVMAVSNLLDMLPEHFLSGVFLGFYIGLAFWFVMHRRDVRRLAGMSQRNHERQGVISLQISQAGVKGGSDLSTSDTKWAAYEQVIEMGDATALRAGAMVYPIPYTALPADVAPQDFHANIVRWQEAAQ